MTDSSTQSEFQPPNIDTLSNFDLLSGIDVPSSASSSGLDITKQYDIGEKNGREEKSSEALVDKEVIAESEEASEAEERKEVIEVQEQNDSPQIKKLTASLGEEKFDVPEDAVFTLKIDGKEEKVTLNQLQRNYQGKIPWEARFRETKELQKQVEEKEGRINRQVELVENHLTDILDTFEKNPYLAFEKIAELKGKNPADYLPVYIAQSKKTLDELSKLSEAEAKALMLNRKLEHENKSLEKKQKALDEREKGMTLQQQEKEADNYFATKAQELSITEEEINSAVKVIKESNLDLSKLSPKDRADLVVEYVVNTERHYSNIESAAKNVNPELLSNDSLIRELKALTKPEFSIQDIEEVLRLYIGENKPSPSSPKEKSASTVNQPKGSNGTQQTSSSLKTPRKEEKQSDGVKAHSKQYLSIYDILSEYE